MKKPPDAEVLRLANGRIEICHHTVHLKLQEI